MENSIRLGTQRDVQGGMSWLLVVQPDSAQADALREALRAQTSKDVVVAASLDEALSSIDRSVPDVVLLPTLLPAAVEDYLVTYLASLPGAGHVRILGLPRLERAEQSFPRRARSLFAWPWRQAAPEPGTPGCDAARFTRDVAAYLADARTLKEEIELHSANAAVKGRERRMEPRFESHEVPWISFVRFGRERAALINVSARGALLRTYTRPEHQLLRRADPNVRERPRVTLELEEGEVHASGRVIRCLPLKTSARTLYEVAFSFDDSVGLHLPADGALVPLLPDIGDDERRSVASTR